MSTITIRVDEELKRILKSYAESEDTTVSDLIITAVKEMLEDKEDYELAVLSYEATKHEKPRKFSDLCKELGLEYEEIQY
jgi:predicted DNA-binding protein